MPSKARKAKGKKKVAKPKAITIRLKKEELEKIREAAKKAGAKNAAAWAKQILLEKASAETG